VLLLLFLCVWLCFGVLLCLVGGGGWLVGVGCVFLVWCLGGAGWWQRGVCGLCPFCFASC
ncbi:hypothetical protein, partial [Pseudomonas syringae group genomosp. 7]|uniref:hypothetical protein n=1 Tax=Pseudomonas syringae group genomosp. 7 TaxID=251699 RepID=UPI00376FCBCB